MSLQSLVLGFTSLLFISFSLGAAELKLDFTEADLDKSPKGYTSTVSREGGPGEWKVILDEAPGLPTFSSKAPTPGKRPVLAQLSQDKTGEHYPLFIYDQEVFGDFTFTTKLKTVSGVVEQMAGVVFRYQDEKNYYYVRIDSVANTLRFLKLEKGLRGVPIGESIKVPKGVWHELTIECKGPEIKILLNGQQVIPTLDDKSFATGRIGFITKSDAISHFADAQVTYTPRVPASQRVLTSVTERYPRLLGLKIFARPGKSGDVVVISSTDEKELNQPAPKVAADVLETEREFLLKGRNETFVTLPLRDRNGEVIAAVQVVLDPFPGQTESNAIARAIPILKLIEKSIRDAKDLFE